MLLPPPFHEEREDVALPITRTIPATEHTTPDAQDGPDRRIAFVDLETTGLDAARHDIVEIGVVLVDAETLMILEQRSVLVQPERLDEADAEALAVCGFNEAAWANAISLREALESVSPLLEGALIAGHNVGFDWSFLEAGFRRAGLPLPSVDYHRLDTASLAWPLFANAEIESMSLDAVARHLGIWRPRPHRALADALCSYEVAFRLLKRMDAGVRIHSLPEDEREIHETLLERLERGRDQYGPWRVDDGRDYPTESLEEVLDGMHYVAAELVRRRRIDRARRRRVYICHPFANDPAGNIERVRAISRRFVGLGAMPVAPHLYLPQLVDEASDRERALELCLELVDTCDELRVFGTQITEGMQLEIAHAKRRGLPVRFQTEVPS